MGLGRHPRQLRSGRRVTVTAEHGATVDRSRRRADIIVISVDDTVQLVVDGTPTPENERLVEEVRTSFVETGWDAADVAVVWRARQ